MVERPRRQTVPQICIGDLARINVPGELDRIL